jgi:hypothetical protein
MANAIIQEEGMKWTYITIAALMITLIVLLILAYVMPVVMALGGHK